MPNEGDDQNAVRFARHATRRLVAQWLSIHRAIRKASEDPEAVRPSKFTRLEVRRIARPE
jgi:hypothetical protein